MEDHNSEADGKGSCCSRFSRRKIPKNYSNGGTFVGTVGFTNNRFRLFCSPVVASLAKAEMDSHLCFELSCSLWNKLKGGG